MPLPFNHQEGKLLSEVTTLGIGGKARYFAEARTSEELEAMLKYCNEKSLPFFILGKGSNVLFADRGFNGLVIHNKIDFIEQQGNTFRVGAGFGFARLGQLTARKGFGGLEFAAGIPATVGGAIFMNAGAGKSETFQTLTSVVYIEKNGMRRHFKKEELTFSYRTSCFQKMEGAIVEGTFTLTPKESAAKDQRELVDYRLKTQPYKDKSAGCIFRNPLSGSAGRLIEECGLKGKKVGGAEVSTMHANFLINSKNATAEEFLALIKEIKERVFKEKGIELEEEVRFINYDG